MRGSTSALLVLLPAVAAAASRLQNATTLPARTPDNAEETRLRRLLSDGVSARATQTQKLVASDGERDDFFGVSVAVSEGYLVVGADDDDGERGSVYVYRSTDDGSWELMEKLVAPDAASGDNFGDAVAVSGNRLVVGAPWDDDAAGTNQGSVYCYTLDGTGDSASWNLTQKLIGPVVDVSETWGTFGDNVELTGAHLFVGAPRSTIATRTGAVYLYNLTDGGEWSFAQKLVPSDTAARDEFGYSIAVSGNSLVVGAIDGEAAYVFTSTDGGDSWVEVLKVQPDKFPLPDLDDFYYYYEDFTKFGWSVAIDGDTFVVGAPWEDNPWARAGAVYVYVLNRDDGGAEKVQKIAPPSPASYDYFGEAVAVSGDTLIVGFSRDDDAGIHAGSVYVYRSNGATWNLDEKLLNPAAAGTAVGDFFGFSVALLKSPEKNQLVVGACREDFDRGSAYVFAFEYCAEMTMSDAGGDGWNGAYYTFTSVTSDEVVKTGTLALGSSGSDEVCLLGGVYALEVVGSGDFDDEISWTFATMAGEAPYGPTALVVDSGDIFETTPVPTPSPTFGTQAPSST